MVELAQNILGEDGDLAPDIRVIQLAGIDVIELSLVPSGRLGALEGDPFALALNLPDGFAGFGERQRLIHEWSSQATMCSDRAFLRRVWVPG